MGSLLQDFRYGCRMLLNNPRFTAVAVLTLGLAIGASTTVFSWIDTVLLHPFPGVAKPNELLAFETTRADGESVENSYLDFRDYRDNLKSISGLAAFRPVPLNIGEADHAERVFGMMVSGNYFDVLGVKASRGRVFLPQEYGDVEGAFPVVVISDRLWRTRFNADPQIAGKTLRVNQHEMTIVGITPPDFHGSMAGFSFDMWVPVVMQRELQNIDLLLKDRNTRQLYGLARLKPGVTAEQARQEIAELARQIAKGSPDTNQGTSATLVPLWQSRAGVGRVLLAPLRILAAVCLVVLLIACANVANLLLARLVARRKDFSLRLALGARRIRLVRQILAESLLLAAGGALAGAALATWMSGSIRYLLPPNGSGPVALDVHLNVQALAFTVLLCVVTALVAGAAPALHCLRANLDDSLKESGRSTTAGQSSHRLRSLLVISEVSLALVALIGAGLFIRAFALTRTIDPGFEPSNVLVSSFYLATNGYNLDQRKEFCRRLREQLEPGPGVTAVTYADGAPLGVLGSWWEPIEVQGYVPATGENMKIDRNVVAPGYFSLMHIPLLEGRDFTEQDDNNHHPDVMIVTSEFQRHFLGTGNPIGRQVRGWGRWFSVVGVVKDIKDRSLTESPKPFFYAPFRQVYREDMNLFVFVRTAGNPSQAIGLVRQAVKAIDPNVIIFESVPMVDYMGASWFAQKIVASMLGVLGALALLLAALGLYSVMSYSVTQRTHEIGVRMALGAQRTDVLMMVLRRGMALTATGLVVGIGVTLILVSRFVGAAANSAMGSGGPLLAAGLSNPLIYLGAAAFLSVIAAMASYIPARRATKVDPMVALRYE